MKKILLIFFILAIVSTQASAQRSLRELYINEELGLEIRGPTGWLKHVGAQQESSKVIFYKTASREKLNYPLLGVTVDIAPANTKTSLDFANLVLPEYKASAERAQSVFHLLEYPHEITINGMTGARFIYEMSGKDGKATKSIDYKFMQANLVVSIQGMDSPENFEKSLPDFEEAISSFKFKEPVKRLPGATRTRDLKDLLATGKKQYGIYKNKIPAFSLTIPEETRKKWYFVVFTEPTVPFYIVCEDTLSKNMPFISAAINQIPPDKLSKSQEALFEEVASDHERWEKNISGGHINFINKGSPVQIKGLKVFERIFERTDKDIKYHFLYIFLDEFLLQVGLNTTITDFVQDDSDFMKIINTILTKQE